MEVLWLILLIKKLNLWFKLILKESVSVLIWVLSTLSQTSQDFSINTYLRKEIAGNVGKTKY